jgi:anti-sigma B factor antagonist
MLALMSWGGLTIVTSSLRVPALEVFPMSMTYKVRQVGDVTVVDLNGRLSLGEALAFGPGSATLLHDVVRDLNQKGSNKILINLREVSYIDSSGLGDLVTCLTTVRNRGGDLRISDANARVRDLLEITKLSYVIPTERDEESALRAFAKQQKGTTAA